MNNFRKRRGWWFIIPPLAIGFAFLAGWLVMFLWNSILPDVTGVKELSYWQALGILVLGRLLFGGFGGRAYRGGKRHGDPYWRSKWVQMSDEEKARYREEWKKRCGRPPAQEES